MKPVHFDGDNTVYAEDQPEYLPLPGHKDKEGIVTSCWKMTWYERLLVLFTGRVFVQQMTFNRPLQPQLVTPVNPVAYDGP